MKRWSLRILLCFILGAISTVAVAWGGAAYNRWPEIEGTNWTERPGTWPTSTPSHWPGDVNEIRANGVTWSIARFEADQYEGDSAWVSFVIDQISFGWPCLALGREQWGEFVINMDVLTTEQYRTAGHPAPTILRLGIPTSKGFGALPIRPSWPGFLIDTLFYAATWFGMFFGFTRGRQFLRARRGRCPRCGYDLRGQRSAISDQRLAASGERTAASAPGCPECGWNRNPKSS